MALKELAADAVGIPRVLIRARQRRCQRVRSVEPCARASGAAVRSRHAGQRLQRLRARSRSQRSHDRYARVRRSVGAWSTTCRRLDLRVDFEAPSTPRPIQLPAGTGRRFKSAVEEMIPALARELASAFGSESYQRQATTSARAERRADPEPADCARSRGERGAPVDRQYAAGRDHRGDRRRRQPDADQHAAAGATIASSTNAASR